MLEAARARLPYDFSCYRITVRAESREAPKDKETGRGMLADRFRRERAILWVPSPRHSLTPLGDMREKGQ